MEKLLFVLGGALALWLIYRSVKNQPEAYSKENMNKSLTTFGWLALLLIGVIWFAVLLLKG